MTCAVESGFDPKQRKLFAATAGPPPLAVSSILGDLVFLLPDSPASSQILALTFRNGWRDQPFVGRHTAAALSSWQFREVLVWLMTVSSRHWTQESVNKSHGICYGHATAALAFLKHCDPSKQEIPET